MLPITKAKASHRPHRLGGLRSRGSKKSGGRNFSGSIAFFWFNSMTRSCGATSRDSCTSGLGNLDALVVELDGVRRDCDGFNGSLGFIEAELTGETLLVNDELVFRAFEMASKALRFDPAFEKSGSALDAGFWDV